MGLWGRMPVQCRMCWVWGVGVGGVPSWLELSLPLGGWGGGDGAGENQLWSIAVCAQHPLCRRHFKGEQTHLLETTDGVHIFES